MTTIVVSRTVNVELTFKAEVDMDEYENEEDATEDKEQELSYLIQNNMLNHVGLTIAIKEE
jgi:hypothetical protein